MLVLTTFDDEKTVYDAMKAGASGFLLKTAPPARLIDAVHTVAADEALLAPTITRRLIEEFVSRPPPGLTPCPGPLDELTERERQVLQRIARGLSNAEIAHELYVTDATVKTHVNHLLAKAGPPRPRPGGRARLRNRARPSRPKPATWSLVQVPGARKLA